MPFIETTSFDAGSLVIVHAPQDDTGYNRGDVGAVINRSGNRVLVAFLSSIDPDTKSRSHWVDFCDLRVWVHPHVKRVRKPYIKVGAKVRTLTADSGYFNYGDVGRIQYIDRCGNLHVQFEGQGSRQCQDGCWWVHRNYVEVIG